MKGFTWVKLNQYAERRFNKAIAEGELVDFNDFLSMLNSETRMNGGNYTRANTEDLLIATRGIGLERVSASIKQVVYSCLGEHSEKPWEVRRRLELLYGDVERVELFARDTWPAGTDGEISAKALSKLFPDIPLKMRWLNDPTAASQTQRSPVRSSNRRT
jgi:hypothetical protein